MAVLFTYNIIVNSLDTMLYLSGKGGSEKNLGLFVKTLESAVVSLAEGAIGNRSSSILKKSLDNYLGASPGDECSMPIELNSIVDKLKNYNDLENSEIERLSVFCKTFHEYSIDERDKALAELKQ